MQVGPTFVGFKNYKEILFNSELPMYLKNTFIIWMMGFIPPDDIFSSVSFMVYRSET